MSAAITTRQTAGTGATVKGAPLTNTEVDTNFINLNTAIDTKAAQGANSDITSLTGITGAIGTVDYVDFDGAATVTLSAGRMWYNAATGSWNLGMGNGNITQQVGEELFLYGKASAAITDSPLQIVYQTGTVGASGVVTFAPTVAGITNGDLIVGVATESIALNAFGRVTTFGVIHGIATNGTAYGETWLDGDTIWYNPTTGNPTKVKPVAPNIKVALGTVINAGTGGSGSFQVEINHGSVLGGTDSNVQLTSEATNDILQRSAAGYWVNVTPATARTNLGLAIGANVQAWDADLDAIAALAGTSGFLKKTAANTWALDTNTYLTGNQSITVSGDATGSGATAITLTLANSGVTAGTYTKLTVDAKGRVTTGTTLLASDVPTLNQNTTGTAANVTGTVAIANGGTGQTTQTAAFDALSPLTTLGDTIYYNGTDNVRLAGNTSGTKRFLTQTGTGAVSAAPAWGLIGNTDLPSALTGKTYDGLTLTAAATGFTIAGGTTSKTLTVSNTLTLAGTDASTLNIGAGGTLGSAAFTASTAYAPAAGSTSITTLGTIAAGTWQGSVINSTYGGMGVNNGGRTLTVNTNSGTLVFTNLSTTLTIANTGSISGTNTGDQTITLTGDVTGSGTGSFVTTLANSGVTAGTYASPSSVVVDAKGRVTSITAGSAGGITISDDTTTNLTRYLTFTSATTGSISSENVSSTKLTFNPSTGTLTATAMSASSDESLKTDWRDLRSDFLELLASVKHGTYDRLDAPVTQDGVSAQSLRPVMPHSVVENEDGLLSVNYGNAALVAAIKLAERLLQLEARVGKLIEG